jgi:hypothetical protein
MTNIINMKCEMIYVFYSDYDGTHSEHFDIKTEKEKAEEFITGLINLEREKRYGTNILGIIAGRELAYDIVKVVDRIKLKS